MISRRVSVSTEGKNNFFADPWGILNQRSNFSDSTFFSQNWGRSRLTMKKLKRHSQRENQEVSRNAERSQKCDTYLLTFLTYKNASFTKRL